MGSSPFIRHVRQLLLVRSLGSAATVLVIGRDSRVVIAGNARNPTLVQQSYYFVGPRRVAGEIAEVIDRIKARTLINVGENSAQRRKIGVNVGDQRELLHARTLAALVMRRVITTAVSGQAPRNSADCFTGSGTAERVVRVNPNRGK